MGWGMTTRNRRLPTRVGIYQHAFVGKKTPKERDQVEVYDVFTYRLQRCLTVPNARGFVDMTSCEHYCCIYIICIIHTPIQGRHNTAPLNRLPCYGALEVIVPLLLLLLLVIGLLNVYID